MPQNNPIEISYSTTSDNSLDSNCNFPQFVSTLLDCGKIDTYMRYIQLIVIDSGIVSWTMADFSNAVFSRFLT